MHRIKRIAASLIGFGLIAAVGLGAEAPAAEPAVNPKAHELGHIGPLPITNSMVMTWLVALVLIIVVRLMVGKAQLVPTRGQAVIENLLNGIRDIVAPIIGKRAIGASFPLLIGLFTFILIQNWSGLIPGVGSVMMRSHRTGEWMELVRPAGADMNSTLALSAVSFVVGILIVLRYVGLKGILVDLFGNKADKNDVSPFVYYPLSLVFIAVGVLELVSIFFARPISLSFRLYGNIFGGENLLHSMSAITRWGLPMPFYFMELLVGLVQAFVFTLLIAVYIGLLTNHGDDHAHDTAHAPHPGGH